MLVFVRVCFYFLLFRFSPSSRFSFHKTSVVLLVATRSSFALLAALVSPMVRTKGTDNGHASLVSNPLGTRAAFVESYIEFFSRLGVNAIPKNNNVKYSRHKLTTPTCIQAGSEYEARRSCVI